MATTALQRQALGSYGERVAERHLVADGLVVLDRNWRCDEGELDLVLREGRELVVCEVKTRASSAFGTPHEAIDAVKLDRLRTLAVRWARDRGVHPSGIRLDLVAVIQDGHGAATVEHVRGLL